VLTGETGAGKSILVDALQLALGSRAEASLVREGATRAEVAAEFDTPAALAPWLDEAGFSLGSAAVSADGSAARSASDSVADPALLLRRTVDSQGRSRAWINGSPATVAQLREVADQLVDIHGQHAWQSLTRPPAVRALLDAQAGVDGTPLAAAWQAWREAQAALAQARSQGENLARERERLAWQLGEVDKLAPGTDEWDGLNAEHQRLAHGQALLDGARSALDALRDGEPAADTLAARAVAALEDVTRYDAELQGVVDVLRQAQAQIDDAAHTLHGYLNHRDPDPDRLAELDARLAAWISLARRYRRPPAELPALRAAWQAELKSLDAATDLAALEQRASAAAEVWRQEAQKLSRLRQRAAPKLGQAVTAAMQHLGMAGGRFEVALLPQDEPQAYGLEAVELRVAGHAGSTPRPLAKVASGGELSRLALAIAVTTAQAATGSMNGVGSNTPGAAPHTLIFDEIDAGVGGTVADSVGRLMKQLGGSAQVLAVTHLAQVAACADGHFVVAKLLQGTQTTSHIQPVAGEARVAEVARMLGGEHLSPTSRAHAQALLTGAATGAAPASAAGTGNTRPRGAKGTTA
jgi:DNA repair protein RecN (Recombination protein N)